jgi:hypothetical protein
MKLKARPDVVGSAKAVRLTCPRQRKTMQIWHDIAKNRKIVY